MSMPQNVDVNVQGNFSGNLVVGNHNFVVNNPNGGVVTIVQPFPQTESRTRPVNLRPRNFPGLLDRVTEVDTLTKAIQASTPVTVFGESGMGKTSLLRKIAHENVAKNFQDGVVYLSARGAERDDILQNIYDTFFVSPANYKPTDGELRSTLSKVRAVIILDDVTSSREDAASLLDAMPQSAFVLTSEDRVLWGEGPAVSLDGLPEPDALQLFERELGRSLTANEKPVALQICRILLTHPLRILQTASMIREDGLSIPQALQKLTTTRTQSPTVEMAIQKSNDTQKKIFSLLAVAGGFGLTREHMLAMLPSVNFDSEVKSLIGRGFVLERGSSLSLSGDAASSLIKLWNLTDWEDVLVNHFANWLQTGPQDMLIDQASDLLFHLLKRVGEKKQWPQLVKLGKGLERISILQKKWQRWVKILDLLRMAARALADKKLEGWVLHQLGSRSMCLGAKGEAQGFLKEALEIRHVIGDKAGMQVTQHNLNVLMGAPVSSPQPSRGGGGNSIRRLLLTLAGGGAGIVLLVLAFLAYRFISPSATDTPIPPSPSKTFTPLPPTHTFTPTGTKRPTRTPTPTSTPTQAPVILFDFIKNADNPDVAFWEYITDVGTFDELSHPVDFITDPTLYDPAEYMKLNATAYVSWLTKPVIEDRSLENLVVASFPERGNSLVRGSYLLPFPLQAGDVFVARVGHINPYKEIPFDNDGLTYRIYFLDFTTEQLILLDEQQDFMDGKTHDWRIRISDKLDGLRGRFILEVDPGAELRFDFGAWLDVYLEGVPR